MGNAASISPPQPVLTCDCLVIVFRPDNLAIVLSNCLVLWLWYELYCLAIVLWLSFSWISFFVLSCLSCLVYLVWYCLVLFCVIVLWFVLFCSVVLCCLVLSCLRWSCQWIQIAKFHWKCFFVFPAAVFLNHHRFSRKVSSLFVISAFVCSCLSLSLSFVFCLCLVYFLFFLYFVLLCCFSIIHSLHSFAIHHRSVSTFRFYILSCGLCLGLHVSVFCVCLYICACFFVALPWTVSLLLSRALPLYLSLPYS
jgi:hypothetical protein